MEKTFAAMQSDTALFVVVGVIASLLVATIVSLAWSVATFPVYAAS